MSIENQDTPQAQSNEFDLLTAQAALNREFNEPHDGFEPVPFWMILIFSGLLAWGGWYIATYSGNYDAHVYDRPNPRNGPPPPPKPAIDYEAAPAAELQKLGARVFNNCAGCHQQNGEGVPGQYPPLNKSEWVAGDQASPARLARILLHGLNGNITVQGKSFNGNMPTWASQLKDHEIASVLTFIRNNWDNKTGDVIRPSQIAAARAKDGVRPPMTMALLYAIPLEYVDAPAPGAAPPAKKDEPKKDDGKKDEPAKK